MKLVIIFGPQAVGKMTVGHELEKITGLKLFHNHMTIDLVNKFFSYSSQAGKKLVRNFRDEIFKEFARSDMEGMIFTFVWAFDQQEDWNYVSEICNIFEREGGETYLVELQADLEERLERNKSEHRLEHKPSKRNVSFYEKELLDSDKKYRLNSNDGEIRKKEYIKIDNSGLNPEVVARMIKDRFDL
ncbi:MAG TPA: AAA family ATPase [Patescibacteria group bacterium]